MSGGALIELIAREGGGDPLAISMPLPGAGRDKDCHFSFAGIKSFALGKIEKLEKEVGEILLFFLINF